MDAIRTSIDEQQKITHELIDDERQYLSNLRGRFAYLKQSLDDEGRAAIEGGGWGQQQQPLQITDNKCRPRLISPADPSLFEKMADDLTTSSWEGASENADHSSESDEEGDEDVKPNEVEKGLNQVKAPFDPEAIIQRVFGGAVSPHDSPHDSPQRERRHCEHTDQANRLIICSHLANNLLWDEAQRRMAIEVEESEIYTILQCYSCRVAISCDILQHQLLTLVDHIHYHHAAMLMQHNNVLDNFRTQLLEEGGMLMTKRRGVKEEKSGPRPSHVNRLL